MLVPINTSDAVRHRSYYNSDFIDGIILPYMSLQIVGKECLFAFISGAACLQ